MQNSVESHYSSNGIVDRILAAIPYEAGSEHILSAQDFYPFDQFHGRELIATREHGAKLAPKAADHVLDIGSGVGGPARYFADTFGCRVTGVDRTPKFVDAAAELTRLCKLEGQVEFLLADAASLPFNNGSFDHAYCFYVGMNLPDKSAVFGEAARVLRPGGKLLWTEVVLRDGDPHFPLPWATAAQGSFLNSQDDLCELMERIGLSVLSVDDETEAHVELARNMQQSGKRPSQAHLEANAVVLGPDFVQRRKNYIQSLAESRISSVCVTAIRTGS